MVLDRYTGDSMYALDSLRLILTTEKITLKTHETLFKANKPPSPSNLELGYS